MIKTSQKNQPLSNSYNIRIFLLLGLITIAIGYIVMRLYGLQVVKHSYYEALASSQQGDQTIIPAERGEIYLDSGTDAKQPILVATNITKNTVYAVAKLMSDNDRQKIADELGPIISMDPKDLLDKLNTGNQNYLPLAKELTTDQSDAISKLKLTGINLTPEEVRYYPQGNLASQVLGFLGYNGDVRAGQYGVEGAFNQQLAGQDGVVNFGPTSGSNAKSQQVPARDGDDIYLTLDPSIQYQVQQVLQATVTNHKATAGDAIVINPKTGAVLAMANYPDFDPNNYNEVTDPSVFNNSTMTANYEPGSVFKAITMAAGLDQGKVTPQSTYNDTGELDLDQFKIKNSDGLAHGVQTMTEVLDLSLNTGAAYVEEQVGQAAFKSYVQKFGFGKTVGMGLPEAKGDLSNLKSGDAYNVFYATASFGQGITVTPIQLIQAYTPIANGGQMVKPYLIDKIVHPDGTVDKTNPTNLEQVLDPKTAAQLSAMLVDVVENGYGKQAAVKGYYIAGKTGTAQVANAGKPGYDPNKNIGTFVGFGPVENPAFLMLVRIDEPEDVKFAETTAAPAFGQLASFILNYLQIPPTR